MKLVLSVALFIGAVSTAFAQPSTRNTDSVTPLAACEQQFRSMQISAQVPFAQGTMRELCGTIEAHCSAGLESSADCRKAIADLPRLLRATFGGRDSGVSSAPKK